MHKNTYVAISAIHGQGLFAKIAITGGSIIGWVEGKPCSTDGDFILWISERQGIEVLCDFRYINHAEEPNACYYDDLSVVALRDIEPYEEITHNYHSNDW